MATKTATLTVRMKPETKEALEKEAAKIDRAPSWLADKIISDYLKSPSRSKR